MRCIKPDVWQTSEKFPKAKRFGQLLWLPLFWGLTGAANQGTALNFLRVFQPDDGCCWANGGWKLHCMKVQGWYFFLGKLSCFSKMAVLRLIIWCGFWGWKDLIQHVQGDTTVSVFPTDLGVQMKAKGVKLPEWQTLSLYFELYEFALWYRRPSTTDFHDIYGMMEFKFWYVLPWVFFKSWKLDRSSTRQDKRWEITDEVPVWRLHQMFPETLRCS